MAQMPETQLSIQARWGRLSRGVCRESPQWAIRCSTTRSKQISECTPYITDITSRVIAQGLPDGVCLNVNFPAKVKIEGMKVVRAARSRWTEEYQEYLDPHGKPFFWLTGRLLNEEPESTDTDLYWLDRNYATVVPAYADRNATPEIIPVSNILGI